MTEQELAKAIYNKAHLTGKFELRSGKISDEYFDKYRFEAEPELLKEICKHTLDILPDDFDVIAGLEMGGIPLATVISSLTGKPVCFVRKKAKEYGTKRLAEGADIKNKKLLIVEDVITSGGQVVLSSEDLRERGAIVENAVCIIDREGGGKEKFDGIGIKLESLFTMKRIKNLIAT